MPLLCSVFGMAACARVLSARWCRGAIVVLGAEPRARLLGSPVAPLGHAALANHSHADLPTASPLWRALPLAGQGHRPELVCVPAVGALGVEGHLSRRQHAAFDGVNLPDEFALARQCDVASLEENLEVGGPALLGLVGEVLRQHLGEVAD